MNRHRHLFVVTVLVAVTLFTVGYLYYKSPAVQTKIKAAIEKELSSQFGGTVSIANYSVGLLAVSARDIQVTNTFNSVDLSIEEIRIGLSLSALLSTRWEPEKLIDETTLVSPKLTISLMSNTEEGVTTPALSAGEISAQILNELPLRRVSVENCEVTLTTSSHLKIIQFTGLDGTILRKDHNLNLDLQGSVDNNQQRIHIEGTLSKDMGKQFLSLFCDSLPIAAPLANGKGQISSSMSSSLVLSFSDTPYPQAVIADGGLSFNMLNLTYDSTRIITDGAIEVIAQNGEIRDEKILLPFKNTAITGDFSFSLVDGGVAHFQLADTLHNNQLELVGHYTPRDSTPLSVRLQGDYHSFWGDLALSGMISQARGSGVLQLDSLSYSTDWFTGHSKGSISRLGAVNLFSNFSLSRLFNDGSTIEGVGFLEIGGTTDKSSLTGEINKLTYQNSISQYTLPPLKITTEESSLKLYGKDQSTMIKARLSRQKYSADCIVSDKGVQRLLEIVQKEQLVDSGSLHLAFSGDTEKHLFKTKVSSSTPYGDFSLLGSARYQDSLFSAAIDKGVWSYKGITIPMEASLQKKGDSLIIKAQDHRKRFTLTSSYDYTKKHFASSAMTLSNFPAQWLNVLFDKEQIPIKEGTVKGKLTFKGSPGNLAGRGKLSLQNLSIGTQQEMQTQLSLSFDSRGIILAPFALTAAKDTLIALETFQWGDSVKLYGVYQNLDLTKLTNYPGGAHIEGTIFGDFLTLDDKTLLFVHSDSLSKKGYVFKNLFAQLSLSSSGYSVDSLSTVFNDIKLTGKIKKRFNKDNLKEEGDTLYFALKGKGDILSSLDSLSNGAVGGTGAGDIGIAGHIVQDELYLSKGRFIIPTGTMHVSPYTQREPIEKLYADIRLHSNKKIGVKIKGEIDRKTFVIQNSFATNDSIHPFIIGNYNSGVFEFFTEKGGVPLHIPGYMENRRNNMGFFEPAGFQGVPHFTLSGPVESPHVWGTVLLQKVEMTYPPLKDYEKKERAPLNITYHLDAQAKGRSVTYFYQLGLKRSRRAPRIIECTIDPSKTMGLRGNSHEETFKIVGGLRAYKGSLFYGTWYDQSFAMGLDFSPEARISGGYNNIPIIWGSAETYSDSSRLEKVQVKVMTKDPETGVLRQKGRFNEVVIAPNTQANSLATEGDKSSTYHKLTSQTFTDASEAGDMVSEMGDRYMSSYFLNYWGRQLARKIGLDMIRVESSMMNNSFNYFQQKSLDGGTGTSFEQIALANTGITVGKYLFGSDVFFKWRTEFGTQDSIIVPEYKIGLEYQPIPYLWMDFNYGLSKDAFTEEVLVNPEVRLQLRLPIRGKQEPK